MITAYRSPSRAAGGADDRQSRTRPYNAGNPLGWPAIVSARTHPLHTSYPVSGIHYALARWNALVRYLDDGRIELDNSAAERALRAVAVGRRNYLFAGSDAGGERAAVFYSLIGSAKLNGLDPEAYLRHVFGRIADHPISRIEELLPWNVAPSLSLANQAAA
jgi:hypothetical protein